jgi:tetratricopeptide (TPR) repeat protein
VQGTASEANKLVPYDQSVTRMLAELYIRLKQVEKAEDVLDVHLKEKSKDDQILCIKAKLAFNKGELDSALKLFTKASKIDKKNMEYRLLIALVHQKKNKSQNAFEVINNLMAYKEHDDKRWRDIGTYYSNIGALDLAVYALEKAIRNNNNEPEYVRDLAIVYRKNGDLDKAIAFAESKVDRFKKSDRITRTLGDLYLDTQDYEKAEMYTRRALEVSPKDPFLVVMLGDILYRKGVVQQAEEEFKRAIEMNKSNPEINVRVGQVYLNSYDFDKAEAHFKAAIGMIPNYEPAMSGLKLLEYLSTKKIDPRKVYEQVKPQLMALASDKLTPTKDGRKIHVNLLDALVDDPDLEG